MKRPLESVGSIDLRGETTTGIGWRNRFGVERAKKMGCGIRSGARLYGGERSRQRRGAGAGRVNRFAGSTSEMIPESVGVGPTDGRAGVVGDRCHRIFQLPLVGPQHPPGLGDFSLAFYQGSNVSAARSIDTLSFAAVVPRSTSRSTSLTLVQGAADYGSVLPLVSVIPRTLPVRSTEPVMLCCSAIDRPGHRC